MIATSRTRRSARRRAKLDERAVRAEWDLSIGSDRFAAIRGWIWSQDAMPRDELAGGGFADVFAPPVAWMRRG